MVLFGGTDGSTFLGDTWIYNGTTWTQQSPASSPPARYAATMAYDAATGTVVLFGGYGASGDVLGDTWTYNGTTWTQQTPASSPPVRRYATMAYDAATGTVVLFGGYGASGVLGDTWTYNGNTWTQQDPASTPPARYQSAMAYNAATATIVLFGGYTSSGLPQADTWTYNGTTWTQQNPASSPAPRSGTTMAYDAATGTVVLFGGKNGNSAYGDTSTYNGTTWTMQSPASSPAARSYSTMAYDAATSSVVLFGGYTGTNTSANDTWTYAAGSFAAPTTPVGTAAAQTPVYFTIGTGGTLPALSNNNVLTTGIAGLDFTLGTGSTCSGAVTAGQTCTVNVAFKPGAPGLRQGAVYLLNSSGTIIATAYISGTGTGSLAEFTLATSSYPITGLNNPHGVAVDAAGNVFVSSNGSNTVLKYAAGSNTGTPVGSGYNSPTDVTIDGAGTIYVADYSNNRIVTVTAAGVQSTLGTGYSGPAGIAVDGAGNVYEAEYSNNGVLRRIQAGAGPSGTPTVLANNLPANNVQQIALDPAGNVYVAAGTAGIYEVSAGSAGGATAIAKTYTGYAPGYAGSISADAAGNLYIADIGNNALYEVPAGTSSATVIASVAAPFGITAYVGNVYFTDTTNNRIGLLTRSTGTPLAFPTTAVGTSSAAKTVTLENDGNANLAFSVPASGLNPAITGPYVFGNSSTCPQVSSMGMTQMLASGATCTDVITFQPTSVSTTNPGTLTTSDNSNNAASTQVISLSGPSTQGSQTINFPQPATPATAGSSATLTATASSGLAINYTITSGPATISGSTVTYTGVGTVVIAANQAGNANYTAAPTVSDTVTTTAAPASYTAATEPVGTASPTQTAYVTITTAGTPSTISVVTQGATGLDFAYVSGGTCATGTAYTVGQVCSVQYTFKPTAPGLRLGAIILTNSAGTVLGQSLVSGQGTGPEVVFAPGTLSNPVSGLPDAFGIASDSKGNLYVTTSNSNSVIKLSPSGTTYTQTSIAVGANSYQVAVDGAGNLFVTTSAGLLKETLNRSTGAYIQSTISTSYTSLAGVAVDGAGNLYLANQTSIVLQTPNGSGGYTSSTLATGLNFAFSITVDASLNLYVNDAGAGAVYKYTNASGTYTRSTIATGLSNNDGIAVDAGGVVYVVADGTTSGILRYFPNGSGYTAQPAINAGTIPRTNGIALDGLGNLYITSDVSTPIGVFKLDVSDPPAFDFPSTAVGSASASQNTVIQNVGNAALTISSITSSNRNFAFAGAVNGATAACGSSLASAATCNVAATFTPQAAGAQSANGVVTDNSLNVAGSTQTVALSGTGLQAQTITFTQPATPVLVGATATLSATSSSGMAVTFSITSGSATLNGNQITYNAAGPVVIAANQAGNGTYAAAPTVSRTVQVQQQSTITWNPSSRTLYNGVPIGVGVLDATSTTPGTFAYTANLSGQPAVAITPTSTLAVGTYLFTANFTPTDTTNNSSASALLVFTVVQQEVFVTNSGGTVTSLYDNGAVQSSAISGGGRGAAVDASGYVFSLFANGNGISQFSDTGRLQVVYSGYGAAAATALAIDGRGLVFFTNGNGTVDALSQVTGTVYATPVAAAAGISSPTAISVDSAGSLWIASSGDNSAVEIIGIAAPVVTPTVNAVKNSNPGTRP